MKNIFFVCILFISQVLNAQKLTDDCENFDLHNYQEILKSNKSGLYVNPLLDDHCFYLSFYENDNLENAILKTNNPEILARFEIFKNKSGTDVYQKYVNDEKVLYKFFKFDKKSIFYTDFKNVFENFTPINNYFDDFIFLHEAFHLVPMRINHKDEKYLYEVYSDLSAILVISKKYNLNSKETIDIIKNISVLRPKFLHLEFNTSSYNKIYKVMIEYINENGTQFIEADTMRNAYMSVFRIVTKS